MQNITISREMAHKCAEALVKAHNSIPQDAQHQGVILVSFRSVYEDLKKLDMAFMIASAQRPGGVDPFTWNGPVPANV